MVRGSYPLLFLRFPPFLEIQDALTFHRSIRKTKVLNNSCNQFVYHFYPQSILVLEECLQKWWNANAMKLLLETATYIAIKERVPCIITMETVMCIMHSRKYYLHNWNRDSDLHNYNKNCHLHICCRNVPAYVLQKLLTA